MQAAAPVTEAPPVTRLAPRVRSAAPRVLRGGMGPLTIPDQTGRPPRDQVRCRDIGGGIPVHELIPRMRTDGGLPPRPLDQPRRKPLGRGRRELRAADAGRSPDPRGRGFRTQGRAPRLHPAGLADAGLDGRGVDPVLHRAFRDRRARPVDCRRQRQDRCRLPPPPPRGVPRRRAACPRRVLPRSRGGAEARSGAGDAELRRERARAARPRLAASRLRPLCGSSPAPERARPFTRPSTPIRGRRVTACARRPST